MCITNMQLYIISHGLIKASTATYIPLLHSTSLCSFNRFGWICTFAVSVLNLFECTWHSLLAKMQGHEKVNVVRVHQKQTDSWNLFRKHTSLNSRLVSRKCLQCEPGVNYTHRKIIDYGKIYWFNTVLYK